MPLELFSIIVITIQLKGFLKVIFKKLTQLLSKARVDMLLNIFSKGMVRNM